ncbi:hypothetical protein [Absidia glauca]|uniref:Uncharacterized protein n=1 Tax=Absidia glauca TaxID=4829 RepID=A0A168P2M0_ABSGL|nr:hypothetical protein [Absidia glauca]
MASPITLTHQDESIQEVTYGVCAPTMLQDPQINAIKFNAISSCMLFEDGACQTSPVATLEPIVFNADTIIRKGDSSELISHFFICSQVQ